ncbi:MAG TPA: LacI family DNA-binding transcriptional regulator [Nocardioides sp.]|uniref:LacI family DNA-binding transcriptional regulator n=1 Tax=Nocardioides sp. TaxID=35761 RepID=UPI002E31EBC1|nr:LacI family DNA-binding transcriptional regulator [Nocardioides sp.]HEX5090630.1 LacI family DNA-binding transcriptional regulator [Nocardioides sp.]
MAKRARVSRALVSLVMRNSPNVSEQRRRRVLRAAEELGYRPNAYARSLASKRLHTIGVLINDVTNPYFGGVYSSFAAAAEKAGFDLLVAPGTRSADKEAALVRTLLEHRVAGLALLSPLMTTKELRSLTASWPTVLIGRDAALAGVDVVTTDELQAARLVLGHLTELGHRSIVHITGGPNRSASDRASGYRTAMRELGLEPSEISGAFSHEAGQEAAREVMRMPRLPTAVVAANDLVAVGAMGVFESSGLRVPGDISVVGYDDSQIARLDLVQLTSICQGVDHFGSAAVQLLTDRIADPDTPRVVERIETNLVIRRTTAPARRGQVRRRAV